MTSCHPWAFGEIQDGVQEVSQIQELPFLGTIKMFEMLNLVS